MKQAKLFPVLLVGYGNYDRQDDGVAWHILSRLAHRLNISLPDEPESFEFSPGQPVDFYYSLQLTPEMADLLGNYRRVCFIDAHTGAVPEEIHFAALHPQEQASPFTHHMTPAMLLYVAELMVPQLPDSILVSVRGYQFTFERELSPATDQLAGQAVDRISQWLGSLQSENL